MDGLEKTRRVAIACQGGGSHTAFTAGTLKKRLVERHERYDFVAFNGTSGGAVCALLAWYALIEHGKGEAGAREAGHLLDQFLVEDNAAKDPPERLLIGWLRWQKATGLLVERGSGRGGIVDGEDLTAPLRGRTGRRTGAGNSRSGVRRGEDKVTHLRPERKTHHAERNGRRPPVGDELS